MLRTILNTIFEFIVLLIIADVLVSYFLSPYQPVRKFLDQIVQPLLSPIRSLLPQQMMFDISPVLLILMIELIKAILFRFL